MLGNRFVARAAAVSHSLAGRLTIVELDDERCQDCERCVLTRI